MDMIFHFGTGKMTKSIEWKWDDRMTFMDSNGKLFSIHSNRLGQTGFCVYMDEFYPELIFTIDNLPLLYWLEWKKS
jgi:hypothetical protein